MDWIADFTGKSAFVTGAGGGIGLATALGLLGAGAEVTLFDLKDTPADLPAGADYVQGDVSDEAAVSAAIAARAEASGRLNYLVNAAGVLWFETDVSAVDIDLDVWIANYVLMDYGTGVVMGVPAHDERDYEFAEKYNIEIKKVIECDELPSPKKGVLINSDNFTGQESVEAIHKINAHLKKSGIGKSIENFRLRDWGVSRQRFWGCPIPVIYEDGEPIFLENKDLPVKLPKIKDGESPKPLSQNKAFFDLGPEQTQRVFPQ